MKRILIYSLILISQFQLFAQSHFNGLYTNDKDEFVCFNNDTISYRIFNHSVFLTFSIGKGKYKIDKKQKHYLIKTNSIYNQTSTLEIKSRNDNRISLTFLDSDSIPIFAQGAITRIKDKKSTLYFNSDENGYFDLFNQESKDSLSLINEYVSVNISNLDYKTTKEFKLIRGYNYIIRSTIPIRYGFNSQDKDIKISFNEVDSNKIEIGIGDRLTTTLTKRNNNCACSDSLFREKSNISDKDYLNMLKSFNLLEKK